MPDRVKEAIFDMLGSYYATPGELPPLVVADVFAGSGSMGLESLSRGARLCSFFERDRVALEALQRNLTVLDAIPVTTVLVGDAWRVRSITRDNGTVFDLVFLDPPYADSHDGSPGGAVSRYLATLAAASGSEPPSEQLVVLHHERAVRYDIPKESPWSVLTTRIYGTSGVTCFLR